MPGQFQPDVRSLRLTTTTHPAWEPLYHTRRWKRLRRHQLRISPLCSMCLRQGLAVPAAVVDHVEPHKGNLLKFWCGQLQSLCKPCHDSRKRFVDLHGYDYAVGADGWPLDNRHPVYNQQ